MPVKTVKRTVLSLWLAAAGLLSPVWIRYIYSNLVGNGGGAVYEAGAEAGVFALCGLLAGCLWVIAVIPAMVWLCLLLSHDKKWRVFLPLVGFAIACGIGVLFLDWPQFLQVFGTTAAGV